MVAGSAGAMAAVVVARGEHWKAVLLIAPVYLTYRTYEVFVGRLADQARHMGEMRELHQSTSRRWRRRVKPSTRNKWHARRRSARIA